jgi:hypothetical protein
LTPAVNISVYGWAAHLSAAATILTFMTGILFFSVDKKFGKVNELFSVIQVLLMIPLVFFFNQLITPPSFSARFISSTFGLGGILVSAYGQIRLLANKISFGESQKFFPAGGAIGFWLIMVNVSLIGARTLPTALIGIGIAAGVGYLLIVGGFIKGGQQDPLFYGGSLLLGICYPAWGFWLGKIILESLLQ